MTPTPLLIVLPFHSGDASLLQSLLMFLKELHPKGLKNNNAILLCEDGIEAAVRDSIIRLSKDLFRSVRMTTSVVPDTHKGWPRGANVMFETAARQVQLTSKSPWLWLEPDSVPLSRTWLSDIESSYFSSSRLFMGSHVKGRTQTGEIIEHMSGVAVYPTATLLTLGPGVDLAGTAEAFDVLIGPRALARMEETSLIQHFWGEHETPPTFTKSVTSASPPGSTTPSVVDWNRAALFHRCKDGSLFNFVREKLGMPADFPSSPVYEFNSAPVDEDIFAKEIEVKDVLPSIGAKAADIKVPASAIVRSGPPPPPAPPAKR